ncbi:MAG: Rrf2 family transcriptional regulator [Christensenellaceae bacterium]|nr:Rrf2 family transcriptional regulator [Christensenellaceae bacterium]
MRISTRGRYALHLMLDIATNAGDGFLSLKQISSRQSISTKYLEQIVAILVKNNLLSSSRGALGGYKLNRKPEEYSIGEILRTTEGTIKLVKEDAELARTQDLLDKWERLENLVNNYLDDFKLSELVVNQEGLILNNCATI